MTVLALGSTKGSPGVTTTAILMAATWPEDGPALLVEADPDGGSLIPWIGAPPEGGLVGACAASRRGMSPDDVWPHSSELPGGVRALVGPPSPEQAASALHAGEHLAAALADLDSLVVVDCGRLRPESPAERFVRAADLLLIVTRPRLDAIWHLAHQIDGLRALNAKVGLVVIGQRPYRPDEVSCALGVEVASALPDEPATAETLRLGRGNPRKLERSPLVQAVAGSAATAPLMAARARVPGTPDVAAVPEPARDS